MTLSTLTRFSFSGFCMGCRLPLILLVAVLCTVIAGKAMGMMVALPPKAPVERLIKNTQAYIEANPTDADGYYTLARLHYLAFTLKTNALSVYQESGKGLIQLPDDSLQLQKTNPAPDAKPEKINPPTDDELIANLRAAIENYRKAIKMNPKNGLYYLGLARAIEQGATMADKIGLVPDDSSAASKPAASDEKAVAKFEAIIKKLGDNDFSTRDAAQKELTVQVIEAMPYLLKHVNDVDVETKTRVAKLIADYWKSQAIPMYLEAYKLSIAKDMEVTSPAPMGVKSLVGYEAGQSYIRLVKARGATPAEKEQLEKVEADIKAIEGKPKRLIRVPITFLLECPSVISLG